MEKETSVSPDPHEMLAGSIMDHMGIPKNMTFNGILAPNEKQEVGHRLQRLLDVVSDGALVPLMHFTLSRSHVEKIAELKGLQTVMVGKLDTRNNALAGNDLDQVLKLNGFNPGETVMADEEETDVDEALAAADNDIPKWRFEQDGKSDCGIISDEDDSLPEVTRDSAQVTEELATMSKKTLSHTMKSHLYRHVLEDIEVLVNPDTHEVMGETPKRLRELLSAASMKELVDSGVFAFDVAVDIIVNSEIVEDENDGSVKRREDCAKAAEWRQLQQLARGRVLKF